MLFGEPQNCLPPKAFKKELRDLQGRFISPRPALKKLHRPGVKPFRLGYLGPKLRWQIWREPGGPALHPKRLVKQPRAPLMRHLRGDGLGWGLTGSVLLFPRPLRLS